MKCVLRSVRLCAVVILLLALCADAGAQDIYTKSNLPTAGLKYSVQFAQPFGVDPQPGGLNQAWNFESLLPIKDSIHKIQAFDSKDISGMHPAGTEVVLYNITTSNKTFLNTSKPSYKYLGEENVTAANR